MFAYLTRRPAHHRRRPHRSAPGSHRRVVGSWDHLEDRALLAAPALSLVSRNLANNGADVGALFPSISADGRYVAFESGSFQGISLPAPSDLVNGLTVANDAPNVYLRDLMTGTTICLSVSDQAPHTTGNAQSRYPIISANGSTVVFLSNATDLVPQDNPANNPNNDQNVFAWSAATGLVLVTANDQGTGPANDPDPQQFGTAENLSVSANGRFIAYDSEATDLVPGENDINYTPNVFVYDLLTRKNILVSASDTGHGIANGPSHDPVLSADGSTVAYASSASDLDPRISSPAPFDSYQIYASTLNLANDTVAGTTLVSVDPTDTTAGDDTSIAPSISDNGQVVAFQSSSHNLVNFPNGGSLNDAYVRNLATSTTQLVSINAAGNASGDSSSFAPQISGDGNHVLFYSLADNLTTTPVHTQTNVFERNLATQTTQLVSVNFGGTGGANGTSILANQSLVNSSQVATGQISNNGQYVVFQSVATDLVPNFQQQNGGAPFGTDVYLRDTVGGTTTLLSHAVGTTTTGGTGISTDTDLTPNGLVVVFQTAFPGGTDNLVPNDTHGQTQIFVTGSGSGPGSNGTSTPPTIVSEQVLSGRKLNKKHKPVGKPVLIGFEFQFSAAMNPATAGNAGNYQVGWFSTRRVKRKISQVFHPVPIQVQYNAANDSVSLLLTGKQEFAKGGQITVIAAPPGGVSDASGVSLDGGDTGQAGDNGVFTIVPKARGITRG